MRKEKGFALGKVRLDLRLVNFGLLHVGNADHDDVGLLNGIGDFHYLKAMSLGHSNRLAALVQTDDYLASAVFEIPEAFAKASYKNNPEGVLAVVECWDLDLPAAPRSPRLVLVLDEIEKPGNMGAILRTAEAFGVSNIVLSEPVLDFFNPNVVRSSRGLMARLQVSAGTKEEVSTWLEQAGLRIVGTSSKSSKSYWDLQLSEGTAFVLGSEREGLGEFWKERIGEWARIPMEGEASSLNLNASAACLLAEFNRTVA